MNPISCDHWLAMLAGADGALHTLVLGRCPFCMWLGAETAKLRRLLHSAVAIPICRWQTCTCCGLSSLFGMFVDVPGEHRPCCVPHLLAHTSLPCSTHLALNEITVSLSLTPQKSCSCFFLPLHRVLQCSVMMMSESKMSHAKKEGQGGSVTFRVIQGSLES